MHCTGCGKNLKLTKAGDWEVAECGPCALRFTVHELDDQTGELSILVAPVDDAQGEEEDDAEEDDPDD